MNTEIIVLIISILFISVLTLFYKLLKDFKQSIDTYEKSHQIESLDIKNAISTAEKYARALTTNQNLRGEFGENQLEKILQFSGLRENIHYTKQYCADNVKPDFVINLADGKNLIIDSKVILKNYLEYANSEDDKTLKKAFVSDLTNCINRLAQKNYEQIPNLNQPGFILMYIPIEACISLIYSDYDFIKAIELANSKNIIITGTSSLLVTLRLVNELWISKKQHENVEHIIKAGENLYNNISTHAQNLINIKNAIENANKSIDTEINRMTERHNGSIFKEAEKLKNFGIEAKVSKTGKGVNIKEIPDTFLN